MDSEESENKEKSESSRDHISPGIAPNKGEKFKGGRKTSGLQIMKILLNKYFALFLLLMVMLTLVLYYSDMTRIFVKDMATAWWSGLINTDTATEEFNDISPIQQDIWKPSEEHFALGEELRNTPDIIPSSNNGNDYQDELEFFKLEIRERIKKSERKHERQIADIKMMLNKKIERYKYIIPVVDITLAVNQGRSFSVPLANLRRVLPVDLEIPMAIEDAARSGVIPAAELKERFRNIKFKTANPDYESGKEENIIGNFFQFFVLMWGKIFQDDTSNNKRNDYADYDYISDKLEQAQYYLDYGDLKGAVKVIENLSYSVKLSEESLIWLKYAKENITVNNYLDLLRNSLLTEDY